MKILEVRVHGPGGDIVVDNMRRSQFKVGERDITKIEARNGFVIITGQDASRATMISSLNCTMFVDTTDEQVKPPPVSVPSQTTAQVKR